MSESRNTTTQPVARARPASGPIVGRWVCGILLTILLLLVPLYADAFWLQLGFSIAALGVGAIGLNLLTGTMNQLSLGHPFFLAVGALTYVVLVSEPTTSTEGELIGLGLPPVVGMIGGVVLAGLCGLVFSPVSGRLRGIYLGMASLALVLIGVHILNTAVPLSGGFNGRRTPPFDVFGIVFDYSDDPLVVLGVPFQRLEWLWYLGIVAVAMAWIFARNVLRSRPGRAMRLVASSEIASSVMGINVQGYKARVFLLSSVYAGFAGVLYALSIGSIAPQSFGMDLSLQFLAMIVIGGMGSVGGSIAGAAFVLSLPLLIQNLSGVIPFVSNDAGGITGSQLSKYIYGAAILVVLIFKPSGLAGVWEALVARVRRARRSRTPEPSTKE